MKNIKLLIILFITIFIGVYNVSAASASISTNKTKVEVGDSFTLSVTMKQSAAWNIHATATGPVSNCVINQADASSDASDINKTFSTVCKATKEGTITITLSGDVTSASTGVATNLSGTTKVEVVKKGTLPVSKPDPTPTPPSKSTNNKVKELTVVGYNVIKNNDNNYSLTVENEITSIVVRVTPEDLKSSISGTGAHNLVVGLNKIEIVVTSESGVANKVLLQVTRRDEYTLSDLKELLQGSSNEINLSVGNTSKVTASDIESIKNSGKTVILNSYDNNKNVQYAWIIAGNKLTYAQDFNPNLFFTANNALEIKENANYAEGLILNFANVGKIPNGITTKIFVGNTFKDGITTKLYSYDNSNREFKIIKEDILVNNGYVELEIEDTDLFYLTQAKLDNKEVVVNNTVVNNSSSLVIILASALTLLVLFNIWYFFIKKPKQYVG